MSPIEFKKAAQMIYDFYCGNAGEEGHMVIDDLMRECLRDLGYQEGLDILFSMKSIRYA